MRFYLYSVDPLIFSETFIHDIHFVGFDLKDKVVIDIGLLLEIQRYIMQTLQQLFMLMNHIRSIFTG
jgi:hypothetical protein